MFDFLFDAAQLTDFAATAIRLSMPVIFAAIGGVICERAGVFNIALEGQILIGAFAAALGGYLTGSPVAGLALALASGALCGFLLAVLGVSLKGNQIVIGLAITLFASGFTSFMSRIIFPSAGRDLSLHGFYPLDIPLLSDIPLVGPLFFSQDFIFYLMTLILVAVMQILYRTPLGLSIRAVGENPGAVDSAGLSVVGLRYLCAIVGSAIAALGGAYIVLVQVFLFSDNMSAGKGFIALGAIVLGRWNPLLATLACLLFGTFDALQLRLQSAQPALPFQLFAALPYLVSILALVGMIGQVRPPAAGGKPYDREMR